MDKLRERKMNDSYKSPNGKCLENFEFVKKFELVECKILEKSMENQWTYQIVKVYIRCTDRLDLLRNLIFLKVQNIENSMEKYVR